jgi:hypothetical protein
MERPVDELKRVLGSTIGTRKEPIKGGVSGLRQVLGSTVESPQKPMVDPDNLLSFGPVIFTEGEQLKYIWDQQGILEKHQNRAEYYYSQEYGERLKQDYENAKNNSPFMDRRGNAKAKAQRQYEDTASVFDIASLGLCRRTTK